LESNKVVPEHDALIACTVMLMSGCGVFSWDKIEFEKQPSF